MRESYTVLAEYYDRLTGDVGYEAWAAYIQRHFQKNKRPIRRVVELACGTGSLCKLLAENGYEMTAVDLSSDMLSVAAQKCEGLPVRFVCQDMSRLKLPEPVDAVLCCLDSINYVTRPKALQKTFEQVFRWLEPGGMFLFDVKTPLALEEADEQVYLDEQEGLFCLWRGTYSPRRRICGYGIDLFAQRPDGAWERMEEYHEEYAYTRQELEDMLRTAGFSDWKCFGELRMSPPREEERRVFFCCVKGQQGGEPRQNPDMRAK